MAVSQYFNEFIVFSFLGWVYECIYCTIAEKRWQNRGFLFGPICPIYGAGATAAVILFGHILPNLIGVSGGGEDTPIWQIFLICMVGCTLLEYVTSYTLEKAFHARWWDYHNMPMNLNGRICLPASLGFGVAGIVIVKFLFPVVYRIEAQGIPVLTELLSLLFMAVFAADLVLTVSSLTDLLSKVEKAESEYNNFMQGAYENIGDKAEQVKAGGQMLAEKSREAVQALSGFQKNVLRNATFRFSNDKESSVTAKMKETLLAPIGRSEKTADGAKRGEDDAK